MRNRAFGPRVLSIARSAVLSALAGRLLRGRRRGRRRRRRQRDEPMNTQTPERTTLAAWLEAFSRAMASGHADDIVALFGETCFWRDLVAFTWTLRTMEGRDAIRAMLDATLASIKPRAWIVAEPAQPNATHGFVSFETALGRCDGYVRLDAQGRCLTLLTALRAFTGFEEREALPAVRA